MNISNLHEVKDQIEKLSADNATLYQEMREMRNSDEKKNWGKDYDLKSQVYNQNAIEMRRLNDERERLEANTARLSPGQSKRKLEEDPLARFVKASFKGDGMNGLEGWEIDDQRSLRESSDNPYAAKGDFIIPMGGIPKIRQEWTTTSGEDFIDTTTSSQIREVLNNVGGAMDLGAVIDTETGAELKIPKISENQKGERLGETATAAEQDIAVPDFTSLKATTYSSKQISLSNEAIQDTASVIPIVGYAMRQAARRLSLIIDEDLTIGDGTNKPQGFVTAAGSAGQIAAAGGGTNLAISDIEGLYWSINKPYLSGSEMVQGGNRTLGGSRVAFAMHRNWLAKVMQMKDGDGRPIFQMGQTSMGGMVYGNSILGYPVVECGEMDSSLTGAANRKVICFGNFSYDWVIRRVNSIVIRSFSNDSGVAPTNSTLVLGFARCDSRYVGATASSSAYKALLTKA